MSAPMKRPASPGIEGGVGMKCRNPFAPNTVNINPRSNRAIRTTIFIPYPPLRRHSISPPEFLHVGEFTVLQTEVLSSYRLPAEEDMYGIRDAQKNDAP